MKTCAANIFLQFPIFLIASSGVCSVRSLFCAEVVAERRERSRLVKNHLASTREAFKYHVSAQSFGNHRFARTENHLHPAHARYVLPPPFVLPGQLTNPAFGTCPAARCDGGGGAGAVDIRIFSGVVFTMAECPSPVRTSIPPLKWPSAAVGLHVAPVV